MMKKIVSKPLPFDVASRYLREVFRTGGANESESEVFRLAPQNVCVLAPEDTTSVKLVDFVHGGLLDPEPKVSGSQTLVQPVPSTLIMASEIVFNQLSQCKHPTLWIHEPLLTEDELLAKGLSHVCVDGSIYLVYAERFTLNRVTESIRYSHLSWHFLAFIIDSTTTPESVADLCSATPFVLIGAYDGESFLYLQRKPLTEMSLPS
jgi:hypothetical protein